MENNILYSSTMIWCIYLSWWIAQLSRTTTLHGPGYGVSCGVYNICENSILSTYQLFFQEMNESLLIHRAFKYVKGNIPFGCDSQENWVLLPPYEHSSMNTRTDAHRPSIHALVCMVVNTGFIQPDKIFSRNIAIFRLPSGSQKLISFPLQPLTPFCGWWQGNKEHVTMWQWTHQHVKFWPTWFATCLGTWLDWHQVGRICRSYCLDPGFVDCHATVQMCSGHCQSLCATGGLLVQCAWSSLQVLQFQQWISQAQCTIQPSVPAFL
jgi:hypothetical protein